MLTVTLRAPNRIDLEIRGKIDSEAMRDGLDALLAHAAGIEQGRMLYRITELKLPSLGSLMVELSRLPELFGLIGKFDRVAVVADKKWLQKVGEIEGRFFPGVEIRGFDPDQEDEAERWLVS